MNVMMQKYVGLLGLVGLFALASPGAGISQENFLDTIDPALVEAARAEGELTIYTSQDETTSNATVEAFQKAVPGIELRVLRLGTVQIYSRVAGEFNAGVFEVDVLGTSDTRTYSENPGWWLPLDEKVIPTITRLPERAKKKDFVIVTQGVAMMAYNTDMLTPEEAPKIWTDVLKPEFKGKGLFVDPRNSTTYLSWLDYMSEVYGEEFLTKLAAQEFPLVSAGTPAAQEVAAGGGPAFTFPLTRSHVMPVVARGAPLAPVEPWKHSDVSATGSETSFAISARAKHPNAARLYLTWFLTPDAQRANCGGAYAPLSLSDEERGTCPALAERFEPQRHVSEERRTHILKQLGLN